MAIALKEFLSANTGPRRMDRICSVCGARYGDHYGPACFCQKKENRDGKTDTRFEESGYLAHRGGKFYGKYTKSPTLRVRDPNMMFRIGKRNGTL